MGAPSRQAMQRLLETSSDQFFKSWYVCLFKMPYLPEKYISSGDYAMFNMFTNGEFNENFTEEDLEAYKYTFSKPGEVFIEFLFLIFLGTV